MTSLHLIIHLIHSLYQYLNGHFQIQFPSQLRSLCLCLFSPFQNLTSFQKVFIRGCDIVYADSGGDCNSRSILRFVHLILWVSYRYPEVKTLGLPDARERLAALK